MRVDYNRRIEGVFNLVSAFQMTFTPTVFDGFWIVAAECHRLKAQGAGPQLGKVWMRVCPALQCAPRARGRSIDTSKLHKSTHVHTNMTMFARRTSKQSLDDVFVPKVRLTACEEERDDLKNQHSKTTAELAECTSQLEEFREKLQDAQVDIISGI